MDARHVFRGGALPASLRAGPTLLDELRAQYPELTRAEVAHALDRASRAATRLAGGAATGRVALLARDRLDLLRARNRVPK